MRKLTREDEMRHLMGVSDDPIWLADLIDGAMRRDPSNPLARPLLTDKQWQVISIALRAALAEQEKGDV